MKMLASTLAILLLPLSAAAQPVEIQTVNKRADALRASCRGLAGTNSPSGMYWVQLNANSYAVMYCNNEVTFSGLKGGWTLVWSNLRGGRGKLTSEMHWGASIETLPRYRGAMVLGSSPDLQSFEVYTGLKWWKAISEAPGGRKEMMYEWAHNYGDQRQLDRQAACPYQLNSSTSWTITFASAQCQPLIGQDLPGLFSYHNGKKWSTTDVENDEYSGDCSNNYGGTPWWYGSCWSGSISGSGEYGGDGAYKNGAHWTGSAHAWGSSNGQGAGNGWLYIR